MCEFWILMFNSKIKYIDPVKCILCTRFRSILTDPRQNYIDQTQRSRDWQTQSLVILQGLPGG